MYVCVCVTMVHCTSHISPAFLLRPALSFLGLVSSEQTSGLTTMTAARVRERREESGERRAERVRLNRERGACV